MELIELLGEKLNNFPHFRIGNSNENLIQNLSIELLGVKDLGKLKDRFEGQAYRDNTIEKIGAYLACCDYFSLPKPNLNLDFIKEFKPIIKKDKQPYVIVVMKDYSLPVLTMTQFKAPRIFVIHKGNGVFLILGIASVNVLNDTSNYLIKNEKEGQFINIQKLEFLN